ncbi:MAG: hypothetical protein LBS65_01665 [Desulfovibrio sp.]|jgi:hypothetical protein|nr:hypothetical protein [Desulfovibrio sp.]
MASLNKQIIGGHEYWYIRETARVNGKPKTVNSVYLGSVANIMRMATSGNSPITKIQSKSFGSLWVADQIEKSFGLAAIVDSFFKIDSNDGPSIGEYFLYAVLNRMVDAVSKESLPEWFAGTVVCPPMLVTKGLSVFEEDMAIGMQGQRRSLKWQHYMLKNITLRIIQISPNPPSQRKSICGSNNTL